MVIKRKTRRKTFWETYGKKIKITILVAFCSALGLWAFSSLRDGLGNLAASIDNKYNNQVLAEEIKPTIEKKISDVKKEMDEKDNLVAQQSVKTFEMYQQKLDMETKDAKRKADLQYLEDLKCQKTLVEKELVRDSRNQYLHDRLEFLKNKIQQLEKLYY
jgi:hypothetical protein